MASGRSHHTLRPIRAAEPSSMASGHPFPLWRTLGFPPRGGTAPCATSAQWVAVVSRLRDAMPPGVKLPRMGSWPTLWALVHATAPPAHTTWAQLCGNASVDTIVARLEGGAAAPPFSCYSWNARWVKASTPKAALKRQFVLDKVLAGQVVCVQETHWSEAQGFAWAGLFPAAQVAFAHAHTDPRGVTRGGVAVLVPHRARIVSQRVLAPGCAVECCVDYGEEGLRTFWSVYLPPGSQGDTLDALWDALPPPGSALVIAPISRSCSLAPKRKPGSGNGSSPGSAGLVSPRPGVRAHQARAQRQSVHRRHSGGRRPGVALARRQDLARRPF